MNDDIKPVTQPDAAPVVEEPQSATPPQAAAPEAPAAEATKPEAPKETPLAPQLGNKTPHDRRAPVGIIIVALIVAGVLAGLTVFALKQSSKTTPSANSPKTATAAVVKSSDVEQTSKDVQDTVSKIDDSKDLSTNDISDATLGL